MKRYMLAGVMLLGAAGLPALAQSQTGQFFSTFNGVNPRNVNFKVPAATTRAMRSMNMRSMSGPAAPGMATPNLNSYFPRSFSLGTWPPKVPNVFIQQKSPYQPNPPKGINPFDLTKKK